MKVKRFVLNLIADPVILNAKGKLLSAVSCFTAILVTALLTRQISASSAYPIMVASMGASAVILFIIPHSPLAQPWPLIGGQLVSASIGIACTQLIADTPLASACAAGGSVLAMLLLRCLHPPGAATALAPTLSGNSLTALGYDFVLAPVGLNVAVMLMLAIAINRWLLGYQYPIAPYPAERKRTQQNALVEPQQRAEISVQDLESALKNMEMFMDIAPTDLNRLLTDIDMRRFQRFRGNMTCADIMVKNVFTVEYGTEVEDAWKIMHGEKLKAMPVIDKHRRVIGIITWHEFFKFVDLSAYHNFPQRFRAFIRRSPGETTNKPEAVGHLMTRSVAVLQENVHIAALIPLMSDRGLRQIPIVNAENRLVGMVYQANLIAALYHAHLLG
jgi:CBS domain-containing membrane protein